MERLAHALGMRKVAAAALIARASGITRRLLDMPLIIAESSADRQRLHEQRRTVVAVAAALHHHTTTTASRSPTDLSFGETLANALTALRAGNFHPLHALGLTTDVFLDHPRRGDIERRSPALVGGSPPASATPSTASSSNGTRPAGHSGLAENIRVGASGLRMRSAHELFQMLHASADRTTFAEDSGPLGPDLFGLRQHPMPPAFLKGFDYRRLLPEGVAPFFRAISMTRPAPSGGPLRAEEFRGGNVIAGTGASMPIPRVRFAIWLGGPLQDTGTMGAFRTGLERSTRALGGSVTTVLLTDVHREQFERVRSRQAAVPVSLSNLDAAVADMLRWARNTGVELVHSDEIFPADNAMLLREEFATELAKQIGTGYAAASDILRLEILYRFGGLYIDADDAVTPHLITEIRGSLAAAGERPLLNVTAGIANSLIIAPARNRFVDAYLRIVRRNYTLDQAQIFQRIEKREERDGVVSNRRHVFRRNSVVYRTGPFVVQDVEEESGISPFPVLNHYWRQGNSWFDFHDVIKALDPPAPSAPQTNRQDELHLAKSQPAVLSVTEVDQRLVRVTATLVRDLFNRSGDLNLTQVAPLVERLPDPGAGWEAVLRFISTTPQLASRVRTVTLHKVDMNNKPRSVTLPPGARGLFAFDQQAVVGAKGSSLIPGMPSWVLGGIVEPARILRPNENPGPDVQFAPESTPATMLRAAGPPIRSAGPSASPTQPVSARPATAGDAVVFEPGQALLSPQAIEIATGQADAFLQFMKAVRLPPGSRITVGITPSSAGEIPESGREIGKRRTGLVAEVFLNRMAEKLATFGAESAKAVAAIDLDVIPGLVNNHEGTPIASGSAGEEYSRNIVINILRVTSRCVVLFPPGGKILSPQAAGIVTHQANALLAYMTTAALPNGSRITVTIAQVAPHETSDSANSVHRDRVGAVTNSFHASLQTGLQSLNPTGHEALRGVTLQIKGSPPKRTTPNTTRQEGEEHSRTIAIDVVVERPGAAAVSVHLS
ncbi:glycosyltransferase [Streptomyces sp. NPDC051664]|uniref:glycosyltransferase n=1 Tax=Streptomyces sp. NPDC051664 TaxID=3365668 RepID=UPI0037B23EA0